MPSEGASLWDAGAQGEGEATSIGLGLRGLRTLLEMPPW